MKRPTCTWCNPLRIDNHPELIPSGYSDPKVYKCSRGSSCHGLKDRPAEFNYFGYDGKPIPYEPPNDGKAGYSPQPGRDPKKIVRDPWKNDPANAPN